MLKFVHTKPPRAKSTSPAGSTGSLERSASPRHRDRPAYPSYPPPPQLHPSQQPSHGEVGPSFQPRGRPDRSGRLSPGSASRTLSGFPAEPPPPGFEGEFHHPSPSAGTFQGARSDRGRVTFPSESELSTLGRFPVTDRDRGRAAERSRTASPRDRHVRIAPYPAEEIPAGSRPSPFPVSERDRSDSPSSGTPPSSILTKHPRDRAADARSVASPPGPSRPSWDRSDSDRLTPPSTIGARQTRGRARGAEGKGAGTGHSWASAREPPASGTELSWARPQQDRGAGRAGAGARERGGREPAERGGEWDRGREGEPQRDRCWKPKLFFSGSWLHGPSRHRIFATKSAQPQPPVCMIIVVVIVIIIIIIIVTSFCLDVQITCFSSVFVCVRACVRARVCVCVCVCVCIVSLCVRTALR